MKIWSQRPRSLFPEEDLVSNLWVYAMHAQVFLQGYLVVTASYDTTWGFLWCKLLHLLTCVHIMSMLSIYLICRTGYNIWSGSRWVTHGTLMGPGTRDNSWFLTKQSICDRKLTTNWFCVSPLVNVHLDVDTLSACIDDLYLAMAKK